MKFLLTALLGFAVPTWTFEGDWSAWDDTRGIEGTTAEGTLGKSSTAMDAGEFSFYEYRTLGRSESRWMGSLDGQSPTLADLNGNTHFDWTRLLGRAEAYSIDGSSRTAPYLTFDRAPIHEPLTGREMSCNLVDANRDRGRDEAHRTNGKTGNSNAPPTTWEMDEDDEIRAADAVAGTTDC